MFATDATHGSATRGAVAAAILPVFALALLLSAALLFSVQPLAARMVLPLLGGSPGVWNAAMVFFQSALLLGYLYAHLLVTRIPRHLQGLVHMAVLAVGALFVPFAIGTSAPDVSSASIGVIVLLAGALGVPFVALSANAPLLQGWFARTAHRDARDPYFLYGASNIGSVVALLGYPLVIEPFLSLREQTVWWATGYIALAVLIYAAHSLARRMPGRAIDAPVADATMADAPSSRTAARSWAMRLRWIAAAAVPSALMLAVTTHITTNIAAAPFLWVLPLTLYLLTFTLVFERRRPLPWRAIGTVQVVLTALALTASLWSGWFWVGASLSLIGPVVFHLALFFTAALVCHGDLARNRPPARDLTTFYLCMSIGGVVGGATTALLAPAVFDGIVEYPLLLAAACLFLPIGGATARPAWLRVIAGTLAIIGASALLMGDDMPGIVLALPLAAALVALIVASRGSTARVGVAVVATLAATTAFEESLRGGASDTLHSERSFYGQHKVLARADGDHRMHTYVHGDTVHNVQVADPELGRVPLAYYALEGTFGDALRAVRRGGATPRVGVIGLGAGALACHARDGEDWTFMEIDPAVIRIARDPSLFTFVSDCAPDARIVQGDARLTIAQEPDAAFDLVIVDAFSSDAVPGHLITVEALELYRSKLDEDGLLFIHTSNRYTDVSSVALAGAEAIGAEARIGRFETDRLPEDDPLKGWKIGSTAIVIGPKATVDAVEGLTDWQRARPHPLVRAWTDDFSNVVSAILANWKGGPIKGAAAHERMAAAGDAG